MWELIFRDFFDFSVDVFSHVYILLPYLILFVRSKCKMIFLSRFDGWSSLYFRLEWACLLWLALIGLRPFSSPKNENGKQLRKPTILMIERAAHFHQQNGFVMSYFRLRYRNKEDKDDYYFAFVIKKNNESNSLFEKYCVVEPVEATTRDCSHQNMNHRIRI